MKGCNKMANISMAKILPIITFKDGKVINGMNNLKICELISKISYDCEGYVDNEYIEVYGRWSLYSMYNNDRICNWNKYHELIEECQKQNIIDIKIRYADIELGFNFVDIGIIEIDVNKKYVDVNSYDCNDIKFIINDKIKYRNYLNQINEKATDEILEKYDNLIYSSFKKYAEDWLFSAF